MQSPEEEIQANMVVGNFNRALNLAEDWLKSFSLEEQGSDEYKKAQEAFMYSRFFIHRQERTSQMPTGGDKARTYLKFLREVGNLRKEQGFEELHSPFWGAARYFMHTQIADGLARDFSGQKSFNLDTDEVMQLATSLVEIENYKAAEEALLFVTQVNARHPLANFLLGRVYYFMGDENKYQVHLREALFVKPELLAGYRRFLPPGVFQELWSHIDERDISEVIKYRYYALTLEINGVYKHKRKISDDEFRKLENDFNKIHQEYNENTNLREEIEPRLLHYLCWLLEYSQHFRFFDKFEDYRGLMIDIDLDVYTTFQEKGLTTS